MSSDPEIRQVAKIVEKESKSDQKNVEHAIKDLGNTEKAATKAAKVSLVFLR